MIVRMWKGWTSVENAAEYEELFTKIIIPRVTEGVEGHIRTNLLKCKVGTEVEFTTMFWFASMDAVKQFAGEHFQNAVVPKEVGALMTRFEDTVHHYEVAL